MYKPCSVVYIRYVVFHLGFKTNTQSNPILSGSRSYIYNKTNDISRSYKFNDSSPVHCLPCHHIHHRIHQSRPTSDVPDPHPLQNFLLSHYREIDRPSRASCGLLHNIQMADKQVNEIKVRQTATANI